MITLIVISTLAANVEFLGSGFNGFVQKSAPNHRCTPKTNDVAMKYVLNSTTPTQQLPSGETSWDNWFVPLYKIQENLATRGQTIGGTQYGWACGITEDSDWINTPNEKARILYAICGDYGYDCAGNTCNVALSGLDPSNANSPLSELGPFSITDFDWTDFAVGQINCYGQSSPTSLSDCDHIAGGLSGISTFCDSTEVVLVNCGTSCLTGYDVNDDDDDDDKLSAGVIISIVAGSLVVLYLLIWAIFPRSVGAFHSAIRNCFRNKTQGSFTTLQMEYL